MTRVSFRESSRLSCRSLYVALHRSLVNILESNSVRRSYQVKEYRKSRSLSVLLSSFIVKSAEKVNSYLRSHRSS